MTADEAATVLTLVSAYDNRTFDELTARAWADALTGLDLSDCLDAVKVYFRRSKAWMMPADLRDIARSLMRDRKEQERREVERLAITAAPPADPQTIADRVEIIRQAAAAACTIPAGPSPHPKADTVRDRKARAVACPWCHVPAKAQCVNTATGEATLVTHERRLIAAGLAVAS